ncbi:MAG TPA: HAD hydrolase-like protein [Gammaproteobacteria bacterium]|nr:HAD hydrolase-like protein [Gammaproteobacteria bacterium]
MPSSSNRNDICCIFDFDGTLVDNFNSAIEKFNILADEFNFKKIDPAKSINLKDLSSRELIKYLKIPLYKIPSALYKARKQMSSEISKLAPVSNLLHVLTKMYDANFFLGIVTSNSKENVTSWLDSYKIKHFFHFIHVEPNYFGKNRVIKKVLKKYRMSKSHVFYIGDETRDIDAAKQNGIYSIAVTWGFNSEKILLQHQPHYIARNPNDLLTICGLDS